MKLSLVTTAFMFVATCATAQHAHRTSSPSETGQSQFAAIAEIAALLRDDPKTDWAKVDIKSLRDHLVDMDNVTTKASVTRDVNALSVTFRATGDGVVAASIQRMVLAHSSMLEQSSDWLVTSLKQDGGASIKVEVGSEDALNQVIGLGFFGLMTVGAHHQQHHLMIATGLSPH